MGLLNEIKQMLKTAGEQITSSNKTTLTGVSFTTKFRAQAKSWGLSEQDAEDVYYHGEVDRWNKQKMKKLYGGYEIGITEWLDEQLRNKGLNPILHLPDQVDQSEITVEWGPRYPS